MTGHGHSSQIYAVKSRRRTLRWWRFAAIRRYYTLRGRRPITDMGGMAPKFGRGKFVSVCRRGPFIEMHDHREGDVIRLVAYQPNHGVMVERWRDGKLDWRGYCDVDTFRRMGCGERKGRS